MQQRLGKGDSQGRYDITRTLTIWLRLQGKSEGSGGGGGGRGHKLKGGQSGSRIAGSHEIVNRGGAQSTDVTGRTDRCREGNYPESELKKRKRKKKEGGRRKEERKARRVNVVQSMVNWDGVVQALRQGWA